MGEQSNSSFDSIICLYKYVKGLQISVDDPSYQKLFLSIFKENINCI